MNHKRLIFVLLPLWVAACGEAEPVDTGKRVDRIATEFVDAYFAHYPEEASESGYPHAPMDRFGDHSEDSSARWQASVDDWLDQLNQVNPADLDGTSAALTYVFARERLQAIVANRVCRMPIWNVSPTWTGWQSMLVAALAVQPVDTADERNAALARAADIPRFIGTEIGNLRRGLDSGFLAPQSNANAVADQMASLIATPVEVSPFFDPATRTDDAAFIAAYRDIVESQITPALERYQDFLGNSYTGRETIGVAGNPDGDACYAAMVRYWSSLPMDPEDIHRKGLAEMSRIQAEMQQIARQHFATDDLKALFGELRGKPEYTFASAQAMLDYVNAAVARAKTAMNDWFQDVPDVELIVYPSPAFEKDSGGGFYSAGSKDGKAIGYYKVGTYNPTGISKAGTESTAFHESWPGHHLQGTIAIGNQSLHPILRYMWASGTGEGWGLYSERLADEIGLYSTELDRLGMLSNEAFRAARLVVDPGIHVLGWTRQQAIDYMLENTAEGYDAAAGEVDRYAAVPGQATSYLVGSLEIQRLRRHAESVLGDRFDIKLFHDRILRNGAVTLPMLGSAIDELIEDNRPE